METLFRLGKRPERTADGSMISHQTFARGVMVLAVVVIVYWSGGSPAKTIMAKRDTYIKDKVFQSMLCAPAYRREIKDLGNESEMANFLSRKKFFGKAFYFKNACRPSAVA